ncbi:hypothetical protein [Rubritalea tangerina]|uniref:hypothetical protein n=1 Tax=Rubritalea tangerina TaxID=430798 RepID=UPI0036204F43
MNSLTNDSLSLALKWAHFHEMNRASAAVLPPKPPWPPPTHPRSKGRVNTYNPNNLTLRILKGVLVVRDQSTNPYRS